jgi:membrane-associated phospholipid phosphatase
MSSEDYRRAGLSRPGVLLALFIGILAPLLVFGFLAEDVWTREGFAWDLPLLRAAHAHATPTRDATMLFFTSVGAPLPMIAFVALALLALLLRGRRGDARFFALAVGGAAGLNVVAKLLFQRARPALWPSLVTETDYSFPSGHAMGSLAVVAALVFLTWRTRGRWPILALGALFVAVVGLSRVYLGVHYPSDILAGWCASLAWLVGVWLLLRAAPWSWWRIRTAGKDGARWPREQIVANSAKPSGAVRGVGR